MATSMSTIQRWFKHFESVNRSLEDQHRSGCPITETSKSNINRVQKVIEDNPYCTYDEIEALTSLSRGTIQNIIHNSLNLKKLTSRWMPYQLSE